MPEGSYAPGVERLFMKPVLLSNPSLISVILRSWMFWRNWKKHLPHSPALPDITRCLQQRFRKYLIPTSISRDNHWPRYYASTKSIRKPLRSVNIPACSWISRNIVFSMWSRIVRNIRSWIILEKSPKKSDPGYGMSSWICMKHTVPLSNYAFPRRR